MSIENISDKEYSASLEVRKFKNSFYKKFGVIPVIKYDLLTPQLISLNIIAEACSKVINRGTQHYGEGIKAILNDKDILLHRQMFYFIALNNGHKPTKAANYLNQSSPNANHALGRINKLLAGNDERAIGVYKAIKNELDLLTFKAIDNV